MWARAGEAVTAGVGDGRTRPCSYERAGGIAQMDTACTSRRFYSVIIIDIILQIIAPSTPTLRGNRCVSSSKSRVAPQGHH